MAPDECSFWATHGGAELDLLMFKGGRRWGVEVKREDAPRLSPSIRVALDDLRLDHVTVLYPGVKPYSLGPRVSLVPLGQLAAGDSRVHAARGATVKLSRPLARGNDVCCSSLIMSP